MKVKITLLFFVAVLSLSLHSFKLDPNNPPIGRTGAPGETTCGASGCHSGGNYTGTVSISGIPDTVVANQSYSVTLTNASNAVRAGFQMTVLDGNNTMCGTFTNGSGTSIGSNNGNGRKYIRQSTPKNISNGMASWTFSWKAPAVVNNELIHFYFVSLAANGNGNDNGDKVLIGTKEVRLPAVVSATENPEFAGKIKLYPVPARDRVTIDMQGRQGQLSLYNVQGQLALQTAVNGTTQVDVSTLEKGVYIAKIRIGDQEASKKLVIE